MDLEHVVFRVDEAVATIAFDRPGAANAIDLAVARDLMYASIRCDEDPDIRAVIVTGEGRFFSAGGDLASFSGAADVGSLLEELTTYLHAAISRLSRMNAPVIAAVNGVAAGAGLAVVAACDIAIAAESASFVSAYTAAALSPDGSSTYFLPRLVGMRRAMELMLTNRRLRAVEAVEWGLVNRVVADDDLETEARDLAATLAAGAPLAQGAVKEMLHSSFASSLETQMELESRTIARLAQTHDGSEGIAAFLEKRPPVFTGR
jgi:2-(1,2-epoxy-1,2-dihydrophenyl)acetyl-CoA isomerase